MKKTIPILLSILIIGFVIVLLLTKGNPNNPQTTGKIIKDTTTPDGNKESSSNNENTNENSNSLNKITGLFAKRSEPPPPPNLQIQPENVSTELPPCTFDIELSYAVYCRLTASTLDDDVYIIIKNNEDQILNFNIYVENQIQGQLEIAPNKVKSTKSDIISDWWDSRSSETENSFTIKAEANTCQTSKQLQIKYSKKQECND